MSETVNAQVIAYLKALSSAPRMAPSLAPTSPGASVFYPPARRAPNATDQFTAPVTGGTGFEIDSVA